MSGAVVAARADSVSDMGVVVVVPGQAEPWMVSNKTFDLLIHEALPLITRPEDRQTLLRAQANGGLFLDHHDLVDQRRIAELLAAAAHHLRRRLMDDPWSGAWEKSLITHLPVLEMWMEGIAFADSPTWGADLAGNHPSSSRQSRARLFDPVDRASGLTARLIRRVSSREIRHHHSGRQQSRPAMNGQHAKQAWATPVIPVGCRIRHVDGEGLRYRPDNEKETEHEADDHQHSPHAHSW